MDRNEIFAKILIIVLMWIGMKSLLRYIILVFIASSVYFVGQLNESMGFFGALYIIFAFLSFAMQIYTNILPNYNKIPSEFFGQIKKGQKVLLVAFGAGFTWSSAIYTA